MVGTVFYNTYIHDMKSTYRILSYGMVAVFSSCLASCSGHKDSRSYNEAEVMTVDVAEPLIDSVVIHKSYPGYLGANMSIDIVARVNGYLTDKTFADGAVVEKGEVLFRIEDTQYRDQLQQAKAQLATAIATNEYATKHYTAMKKALESDAVSQMDVIQSESAMNESRASIESARAAVQTATTMLSYCTVRSPIKGRVAAPNFTVGDYVSGAGAPVKLTTVYDDSKVKANISIEDAQYLAILDNMKNNAMDYNHIPVSFNDTLAVTYFGRLCYVAPNIVTNTGTIGIQVEIDNSDGLLKDGLYALVNLPVSTDPEAVLVRDASIGTDQLGKYMYLVNDSNKVVYRTIETGELVNDSMRIVTSGLGRGDRYVTKALLKVRTGMEVNPRDVK